MYAFLWVFSFNSREQFWNLRRRFYGHQYQQWIMVHRKWMGHVSVNFVLHGVVMVVVLLCIRLTMYFHFYIMFLYFWMREGVINFHCCITIFTTDWPNVWFSGNDLSPSLRYFFFLEKVLCTCFSHSTIRHRVIDLLLSFCISSCMWQRRIVCVYIEGGSNANRARDETNILYQENAENIHNKFTIKFLWHRTTGPMCTHVHRTTFDTQLIHEQNCYKKNRNEFRCVYKPIYVFSKWQLFCVQNALG